jgi:hypothetical protein
MTEQEPATTETTAHAYILALTRRAIVVAPTSDDALDIVEQEYGPCEPLITLILDPTFDDEIAAGDFETGHIYFKEEIDAARKRPE